MFARDARRGIAICGTGVGMAPYSNLRDHLLETLNVLCGRFYRAGDTVPNPPVLAPDKEFRAEVIPADRTWETGPVNSAGYGMLFGEFPSSVLADVILKEGPRNRPGL